MKQSVIMIIVLVILGVVLVASLYSGRRNREKTNTKAPKPYTRKDSITKLPSTSNRDSQLTIPPKAVHKNKQHILDKTQDTGHIVDSTGKDSYDYKARNHKFKNHRRNNKRR